MVEPVVLSRFLPAPPEDVFAAFVDPEEICRWWGPRGCETTEAEIDLRPGGRCRWVMRFETGERVLFGEVVEVEPDRRLVLKNMWDDPAGHATMITIEIRPRGAGSELTIRHEDLPDDVSPDEFRRGWTSSLTRLDELFTGDGR